MRLTKKSKATTTEKPDMTPMIDVTFLLIIFFMVLINFTEVEIDSRVVLPVSTLAKPPEKQIKNTITVQMTSDGTSLIHGDSVTVENLEPVLQREIHLFERRGISVREITTIVRAHQDAPTGKVQEVIEACQNKKLVTFRLRAQEEPD